MSHPFFSLMPPSRTLTVGCLLALVLSACGGGSAPTVATEDTLGSNTSSDSTGGSGVTTLTLTSDALKANLVLPLSATCDGLNRGRSLPLRWSGAPSATQSFAVTMHHFPNPADAPDYSKAHSYWTLFDIPASTQALAEGETQVGTFGTNTVDGQQTYSAPCSAEPGDRSYVITLFALSAPVGDLGLAGSDADLATFRSAIAASTLSTATLELARSRYNPNNDDHVPTSVASTCADKSAAFAAYSDLVSVSCSGNTLTVTSKTLQPERSSLDADKPNVGIRSWIGRVPISQALSWTLPIAPTYLSSIQSNLNIHDAIGISVEGIPILHYAKESSPDEIAQLSTDYSNRDTALLGEIDQCGGHAGNGEDYHYHMAPVCLLDTHDPSMPLAYMFDGLPLYFGTGGGQLSAISSAYGGGRYDTLNYLPSKVKTGVRALDDCNAYDLHGDGSEYVYYSTSTPPYTIGCYRAVANQSTSVPAGPHWSQERDLAWTGSDVVLTDDGTMSFLGESWRFVEITPQPTNQHIASGNTAVILYRELHQGEAGFDAAASCYAFRYRLDSNDTTGTNDTTATHCR